MKYQNAVEHLSSAIQLTASPIRWIAFITLNYPALARNMKCVKVGRHGVVYYLASEGKGLPVAFTGRLDCAPVDEKNLSQWEHEPHAGFHNETYIYGRGAIAPLGRTVALLEVFNDICEQGIVPNRPLYLILTNSDGGTKEVVNWLADQKVILECVCGGGSYIEDGTLWEIARPVAMVGLSQCVQAALELSFAGDEFMTSVSAAASYIVNLNRHPMNWHSSASMEAQCAVLSAYTGGHLQNLLATRQFGGLINRFKSRDNEYGRQLRSHITPISSSTLKTGRTTVTFNVSIVPGQTLDDVIDHLQRVALLCEIPTGVKMKVLKRPSVNAETSTQTPTYQLIADTYQQVNSAIVTCPQVVITNNDINLFQPLASELYRFDPFWLSAQDAGGIDGPNERLLVSSYRFGIDFFSRFIKAECERTDIVEALPAE